MAERTTIILTAADLLEACQQWAFAKSGIRVPQLTKVTLGGSWVIAPDDALVTVTLEDPPENVEHINWKKSR